MARRLLSLWIFPFCLLLAQAGTMSHGLGHAADESPAKERVGTADACVQCASFAKLGHALATTAHAVIPHSLRLPIQGDAPYVFLSVATAVFEPRGPPHFL